VGSLAVSSGCGAKATPEAAPVPAQDQFTIAIRNFSFVPKELVVPVGTTVKWTNWDTTIHSVTGVGDERFDSKGLGNKATFEHTFTKPGRYSYMCLPHPGMQGVIVVQ
jgi:plastocyanin